MSTRTELLAQFPDNTDGEITPANLRDLVNSAVLPGDPAAVPAGGTTGQVLAKNSNTDGDTTWATPASDVNADWNATSGVAQILNKPTIPAAQVQTDWNATEGMGVLLNKPAIGTSAGNLVALDSNAKLPAVDGSQLTNLPSSGGGIAAVVDDTAPQLGGTLNANGNPIVGDTSGNAGSITIGSQFANPSISLDPGNSGGAYAPIVVNAPYSWDGSGQIQLNGNTVITGASDEWDGQGGFIIVNNGNGTGNGGSVIISGGGASGCSGGSITFGTSFNGNDTGGNLVIQGGASDFGEQGSSITFDGGNTNPAQGGNITISLAGSSGPPTNLILVNLPTSDPGVAGAVWSNSGVLTISSGS